MKNKQRNISIRRDEDVDEIINYLSDKWMINTTSIVKIALSNLYAKERGLE